VIPLGDAAAKNSWSQIAYSLPAGQLVVGTDFGPFVSHDLGETWTPLSLGGKEADTKVTALTVEQGEDGHIVLSTQLGMIRPIDGTVFCLGESRCFSLSHRNIALNLMALYGRVRSAAIRTLGF
jgi:hypothetical protein